MASTGFWPVKSRLKAVLDYAENSDKTTPPEYLDSDLYAALRYAENDGKTDRKLFVGGINCSAQKVYAEMTAVQRRFGMKGKVVAYHGIQSFKSGEVTPEQAFEIGKETVRRMWSDRYQVLVTVHLNTDNLHCHFVVNPCSFRDGAKFKNKIGDHKELRKISDEVCREHGLSVLENSEFYSNGKMEYWAHKSGRLTHRRQLRKDLDEALSKCSGYKSLEYYLQSLGYHLERDFRYEHPSVTADGWQRAVRINSLGEEYSKERIRERLLENQRKPELYAVVYPERKRKPLLSLEYEYRKAQQMDTVTLLFQIFIELLKLCTGGNIERQPDRPLSPMMRAEVKKLDQYLEEYNLLCDNNIQSPKELLLFWENLSAKINALEKARYALRLKLRRAKLPEEDAALKERAKEITRQIMPLRKELQIAKRIEEHIPKIRAVLDAERQIEMRRNDLMMRKERGAER